MHAIRTLLALLIALPLAACGRPFDAKTPDGFVELAHQDPAYDYRAVSPQGVVLGVRAIDAGGRGDVEFWETAVTRELRDGAGYALHDAGPVRSADGTAGKRLRFGRDQGGRPHTYEVTVFVAQGRVFVLEAGGEAKAMAAAAPRIDARIAAFRARCDALLAPVLASRTCNRW